MTGTEPVATFDVDWCRRQFPALGSKVNGRPAVFFDGPGGSQVPERVIAAVSEYLGRTNANHGGLFATSRESDALLDAAHRALADLFGTSDPETIVFGPNMTSLTLALSRALAKTWGPGDEVLVSRLDHDANVSPWVLASRDAGATVRHIEIHPEDCTLDMDDFAAKLSPRTRLVAIGHASNAVGTINPVEEIVRQSHQAGALVYVDAVHSAPHLLLDVARLGCDFLVASAYKFFGPHVGTLWGRRELLEDLPAYKVRPAPNDLPGRWMTGTQNHEGIVGAMAAVEYLAELGRRFPRRGTDRRAALEAAFAAITAYERELVGLLLAGLATIPDVRVWGITHPGRMHERVPTVAITRRKLTPRQMAQRLGEQGFFVWHGNFYALPLTEALGLEPEGLLRIGLLHYNTGDEVQRLLDAVAGMA
jgi:cysteine desulfurase family protein (TIGR01976 family)